MEARKAALLAGLSDSFWGMAERGWKPVKGKPSRPMKPSRRTLIQMTDALRLPPQTTNAILTAAGFKPVPAIGEQPDPRSEIDLRGLNQADVVLLNAISRHLRENKTTPIPKSVRSASMVHPGTTSNGGEVQ
jgi:hypothetical protein